MWWSWRWWKRWSAGHQRGPAPQSPGPVSVRGGVCSESPESRPLLRPLRAFLPLNDITASELLENPLLRSHCCCLINRHSIPRPTALKHSQRTLQSTITQNNKTEPHSVEGPLLREFTWIHHFTFFPIHLHCWYSLRLCVSVCVCVSCCLSMWP